MDLSDNILNKFESITLDEMDSVRLMNRVDTKFLFNAGSLPEILESLNGQYSVLETAGTRCTQYETLYFDTPDHALYLRHHNGKQNRVKVRCRKYEISGQCFFEIKHKNNKGRTVKDRIRSEEILSEIRGKAAELLERKTGLDPASLIPVLRVGFRRITLVNRNMTERVTIDTALSFRNNEGTCSLNSLVIAELKQDRSGRSRFREVLHKNHIHPYKVSKYCLGVASINQAIKKNNFKEKLIHIKKITHESNQAFSCIMHAPFPAGARQGLPVADGN